MTKLQTVLSTYLSNHPSGERDLANEFQVAPSTVKRWASGTAHPHPRLAQMIIDFCQKQV